MSKDTKIEFNEIKILWESDYYDGPLSGILLYKNQKYYFDLEDQNNTPGLGWYRKFCIYTLTPEQLKTEEEKQKCFIENVSSERDYTVQEHITYPQEKWKIYNDKYGSDLYENSFLEYRKNEVIGYFLN